ERIPYDVLVNQEGCTDESACNFNEAADSDDGSCVDSGCMDPEASNYDPFAGCDDSCVYLSYTCSELGDPAWLELETGVFPQIQATTVGVLTNMEWVFHLDSVAVDSISNVSFGVHSFQLDSVIGDVPGMELDYLASTLTMNSEWCVEANGIPSISGVYPLIVVGEMFIQVFGQPFSIGISSFEFVVEVESNPFPIIGCTYPTAVNYAAFATEDDGSCIFPGCIDTAALNYSPHFNMGGGECVYPQDDPLCPEDITGDGVVSVNDLLALLSSFGSDCPF
ncbi:MAG: hypothetical protein P8K81_09900, partial [Flavobacteriales bacterium]|nr:hypothetical protein [Flavobacteriales bacterium]